MKLRLYQNYYAIAKLAAIPDTLHTQLQHSIYSLTVTHDEISLVCESERVPMGVVTLDDDWRLMQIDGELDLSMIGIIASISKVLAEHSISIFVISSYNTDYILVRDKHCEQACEKLKAAGYLITT